MNAIKYIVLSLLFFSCSSEKKQNLSVLNPAAAEVYKSIENTEKEFSKASKGKAYTYSDVDRIVNLSGITPEVNSMNFNGINYTVKANDITAWKDWFEKNKTLFSYYENNDINTYYFQNKSKLIRIEYEPNKFRYSVSNPELDRITEITGMMKERSAKTN